MLPSWPPAPISSRRLDGQRSFTDELQPNWVSTHEWCTCARQGTILKRIALGYRIGPCRAGRKTTQRETIMNVGPGNPSGGGGRGRRRRGRRPSNRGGQHGGRDRQQVSGIYT